jgi:hypothetical protein
VYIYYKQPIRAKYNCRYHSDTAIAIHVVLVVVLILLLFESRGS